MDVVVAVRHRAVAPGVRDTGDRGGVTDTRLVVAVVGPPERVAIYRISKENEQQNAQQNFFLFC